MKYDLVWADKKALKTFQNLVPTLKARVRTAILVLAEQARPAGAKKLSGKLDGLWRIRVGDWRVLYDIDDKARKIVLIDVGPRKSVYR